MVIVYRFKCFRVQNYSNIRYMVNSAGKKMIFRSENYAQKPHKALYFNCVRQC